MYSEEAESNNLIKPKRSIEGGVFHRLDGPAYFHRDPDSGNIIFRIWAIHGKNIPDWAPRIREDGVFCDQEGDDITDKVTKDIVVKVLFQFNHEYGCELNKKFEEMQGKRG